MIQRTAGKYAKMKRGTLNYFGNVDLQEYFIVHYDMFDNGPYNEWETQVYSSGGRPLFQLNLHQFTDSHHTRPPDDESSFNHVFARHHNMHRVLLNKLL